MSGKTVPSAILLLVIGNLLATVSDSVIKSVGSDVPVFQFVCLRVIVSLLILLPGLYWVDHKRFFEGARTHGARALIGLGGMACMVVALGALPLATANAVFYLAPLLVMLISVFVLREKLSRFGLVAVVCGLLGIVIILRPVAFGPAAIAALGLALALALNAVLVRWLPAQQGTLHKLILTHLFMLPGALALALWEGAPLQWGLLWPAFGSAAFILGYHATILLAYQHVAANQVTSAEYTGILWAVILGWLFFGEVPDTWFYLGSALIVVPLFAQGLIEHRAVRARRRMAGS